MFRFRPIFALRGALVLALAACHVQFVTEYDQTFDAELSTAYQDIDILLTRLGTPSAADPTVSAVSYAAVAADYARIDAALDAMQMRADARTLNDATSASVTKIRQTFDGLEDASKSPGGLRVAHVRDELGILRHDFQALMALEAAKKRGQT
jgi:hypothetical protein